MTTLKSNVKQLINCLIANRPLQLDATVYNDEFINFCKDQDIVEFMLQNNKSQIPPQTALLLKMYVHHKQGMVLSRYEDLKKIADFMGKNNIEYMLIKGFALSKAIYGDPFVRSGGDIDLIIHEKDCMRAFELLKNVGGSHIYREGHRGNFKPSYTPLHPILIDENAHEYKPVIFPGLSQAFEFSIALHEVRGSQNQYFFDNSTTLLFDGVECRALDFDRQIMYICMNLFHDDVDPNARNYIDLGRAIHFHFNITNWEKIIKDADRLKLKQCLYFSLFNLKGLLDEECGAKQDIEKIDYLLDKMQMGTYEYKYIKYLTATHNYGYYDWGCDILDLMFMTAKTRLLLKKEVTRKRNYSTANANLLSPHNVIALSQDTLEDTSAYLSFYINRHYFSVRYNIFHDGTKVYFVFLLEQEIYAIISKFIINMRLYNPHFGDDTLLSQLDIAISNNGTAFKAKRTSSYSKKQNPSSAEEIARRDNMIQVWEQDIGGYKGVITSIDFGEMSLPYIDEKYCYQIFLKEQFRLDQTIEVRQVLTNYSDNEAIDTKKASIGTELTYPKVFHLPKK